MNLRETLVVVLTGLSGSGKSTALHALEDLGFFCVDNLPTPVVLETLQACADGGIGRVALGLDVRVRTFLDRVGPTLANIRSTDAEVRVVFLDAADEVLLRRYSSTRRPHPLTRQEDTDDSRAARAVLEGISEERDRLSSLRAQASDIIDTTTLSVHELRRRIVAHFGPGAGELPRMRTRIVSFGFKYGAPVDADVILDVRFLDNPYFVPELKEMSGLEKPVADFVLGQDDTAVFLDKAQALLAFCLPRYEREGKSYLTIGIGCTGGRHRSVATSEELAKRLSRESGLELQVVHRDVERASVDRKSDPDVIGGGPKGGSGTF